MKQIFSDNNRHFIPQAPDILVEVKNGVANIKGSEDTEHVQTGVISHITLDLRQFILKQGARDLVTGAGEPEVIENLGLQRGFLANIRLLSSGTNGDAFMDSDKVTFVYIPKEGVDPFDCIPYVLEVNGQESKVGRILIAIEGEVKPDPKPDPDPTDPEKPDPDPDPNPDPEKPDPDPDPEKPEPPVDPEKPDPDPDPENPDPKPDPDPDPEKPVDPVDPVVPPVVPPDENQSGLPNDLVSRGEIYHAVSLYANSIQADGRVIHKSTFPGLDKILPVTVDAYQLNVRNYFPPSMGVSFIDACSDVESGFSVILDSNNNPMIYNSNSQEWTPLTVKSDVEYSGVFCVSTYGKSVYVAWEHPETYDTAITKFSWTEAGELVKETDLYPELAKYLIWDTKFVTGRSTLMARTPYLNEKGAVEIPAVNMETGTLRMYPFPKEVTVKEGDTVSKIPLELLTPVVANDTHAIILNTVFDSGGGEESFSARADGEEEGGVPVQEYGADILHSDDLRCVLLLDLKTGAISVIPESNKISAFRCVDAALNYSGDGYLLFKGRSSVHLYRTQSGGALKELSPPATMYNPYVASTSRDSTVFVVGGSYVGCIIDGRLILSNNKGETWTLSSHTKSCDLGPSSRGLSVKFKRPCVSVMKDIGVIVVSQDPSQQIVTFKVWDSVLQVPDFFLGVNRAIPQLRSK